MVSSNFFHYHTLIYCSKNRLKVNFEVMGAKPHIREQDCVARWGGEEFLFILPQTADQSANILAEKIKDKVQNHLVNYEGEKINVTVSMGIEQFNGNQSIDEIINNADKYLYKAKAAGRNQIFPKL